VNLSPTLGERIRAARKELQMTQANLAAGDYTRAYISLIEHDRVRPSLQTLVKLASRLGKSVSYFLEGITCTKADVLLLYNLTMGYLEQEETEKASPLLEQAREHADQLNDGRLQGLVEMAFCRLHALSGNLDRAKESGLKALELMRLYGEDHEIGRATMYVGNVAWLKRELYEALARYKDALTLLRGSGQQRLLSIAYTNLANTYRLMEEWDLAYDNYVKALELTASDNESLYRARLYMDLAFTHREKGNLDTALEYSAKALETYEEGQQVHRLAELHNNMGSIHARRGEGSQARKCFELALTLLDGQQTDQVSEAYRQLAELHLAEGAIDTALSQATQALKIARTTEDPFQEAKCHLVLGRALSREGRSTEARTHLERAKSLFEQVGMRQSLVAAKESLTHVLTEEGAW